MDGVDLQLQKLLNAESVELGPIDLALKEQDYRPVTKLNVAYIVCGILINEDNEILMMQEAKRSCHGMWYLPAGRIDPNEDIEEAVKREVLEETGIEFEPTTMIAVETCNAFWYRFVFTGKVTGGSLKTLEQKDQESLQAKWCSMETIKSGRKTFPLRAGDILPLIDVALKHKSTLSCHPNMLPVVTPHTKILLRVVCLHINKETSDLQVLIGKEDGSHLPVAVVYFSDRNMDGTLHRLLELIFGKKSKVERTLHGVLSVEYNGKPAGEHDGMCTTLLVHVAEKDCDQAPSVSKHREERFEWQTLQNSDLKREVLQRSQAGFSVPFFMLY